MVQPFSLFRVLQVTFAGINAVAPVLLVYMLGATIGIYLLIYILDALVDFL